MSPADAEPRRGPLWLFKRWALHATVERVDAITGEMRRLEIAGRDLVGGDWVPGQQVRVMFRDLTHPRAWLAVPALPDAARTYSLWDYDAAGGRYVLMVLDHGGDGPGARWVRRVRPGDPVVISRPEGRFHARLPSPYHLFAGEETAAVCFGAIIRALPAGARVVGALQAERSDGHVAFPGDHGLIRVARDGADVSPSPALTDAVRSLTLPDEPGTAYLAGEARTIQAIRRHLIDERGWTRAAILTKPFWTPGKRGMD
jgi:NADPH-dependent ferric siderophore reductase